MKKLTILLIATVTTAIVMALTGCVVVPKTKITGSIAGKPFEVSSPKDSTLAGLDISAETNGVIRIHIDSLQARMNPDVITQAGQAQAQMFQMGANLASDTIGKALGMYMQANGIPRPAPSPTPQQTNAP